MPSLSNDFILWFRYNLKMDPTGLWIYCQWPPKWSAANLKAKSRSFFPKWKNRRDRCGRCRHRQTPWIAEQTLGKDQTRTLADFSRLWRTLLRAFSSIWSDSGPTSAIADPVGKTALRPDHHLSVVQEDAGLDLRQELVMWLLSERCCPSHRSSQPWGWKRW